MNSLQAKSGFIISYLRGIYHHNFQARTNINSPPMKDDKNVEYLSHNYWYVELWIGHGQVLCLEWAHKSPFYNIICLSFFARLDMFHACFWGPAIIDENLQCRQYRKSLGLQFFQSFAETQSYMYTHIYSPRNVTALLTGVVGCGTHQKTRFSDYCRVACYYRSSYHRF